MLRFLPNFITLMNLFCGSLGVIFLFEDKVHLVPVLILTAAILDFFDGFVARLVGAAGPLGKELDSLADMVSFGLVPGLIMYHYLGNIELSQEYTLLPYVGLLITLGACYRLAVFNISTNQSDEFIGVPTPAATLFFLSYPIVDFLYPDHFLKGILFNPYAMLAFTLLFTYLMNASFPLIAMKFKSFKMNRDNVFRYLVLLSVVVGLSIFQLAAIPIIILVYIVLSIIKNLGRKKESLS